MDLRPRAAILLASVGCVAIAGGCLGPEVVVTAGVAAAEMGSSAFIGGQLVQSYKVSLENATAATRRAITDLHLIPGTERPGAHSMFFLARETDKTEIAIRLEEVSPMVTTLKIRVGIFGEQSLSRLIMTEIETHLELGRTPAPAP